MRASRRSCSQGTSCSWRTAPVSALAHADGGAPVRGPRAPDGALRGRRLETGPAALEPRERQVSSDPGPPSVLIVETSDDAHLSFINSYYSGWLEFWVPAAKIGATRAEREQWVTSTQANQ